MFVVVYLDEENLSIKTFPLPSSLFPLPSTVSCVLKIFDFWTTGKYTVVRRNLKEVRRRMKGVTTQ